MGLLNFKMEAKGLVSRYSKCGIKHVRPVGVRCKRALNISAPAIIDSHSSDDES